MFKQTYNFCIVTGRPSGMVPPILLLLRSLHGVTKEALRTNLIAYKTQKDRQIAVSNSTRDQLTR